MPCFDGDFDIFSLFCFFVFTINENGGKMIVDKVSQEYIFYYIDNIDKKNYLFVQVNGPNSYEINKNWCSCNIYLLITELLKCVVISTNNDVEKILYDFVNIWFGDGNNFISNIFSCAGFDKGAQFAFSVLKNICDRLFSSVSDEKNICDQLSSPVSDKKNISKKCAMHLFEEYFNDAIADDEIDSIFDKYKIQQRIPKEILFPIIRQKFKKAILQGIIEQFDELKLAHYIEK